MSAPPFRSSPAAERILRTAAELIAVRGFAATSTRDIAAAVGVRQPAIYKHFSAKDDILAALVRLGLERPLALADELAPFEAPAVVKLHRWLRAALEHLHESPYVLASILTTQELTRERFAAELELVTRLDRVVIDLVRAGQREGDVRAMDPVSGARLVQALFDALALPQIAVRPAEIVEFAMAGLLADPTRLPAIQRAADALPVS
ncbi:TetR family transcriptional regulator [Nocardia brasiliensis]|uniref:TetR family transcriptional regulator n=1 Tax=Nocardia brasiliensis TaxID=37326 RepID=A0A6G9XRP1_NOCBR|nr:TetR/AcrR family transcriptional regulator [Nocardia brasiliensis]QIS03520.1 TetR family transcriptional regulator [Nocardia brasiliensis]